MSMSNKKIKENMIHLNSNLKSCVFCLILQYNLCKSLPNLDFLEKAKCHMYQ